MSSGTDNRRQARETSLETSSWLLASGSDRARLLDMDRRLRAVRQKAFGLLAVALLLAGPWVGWWTLVPLAVAAAAFGLAGARVETAARPEYWMLAAWGATEAIIALSLILAGDAAVSMLAILAIPIVTLGARFSSRGIWVGVGIASSLMVVVALVTNANAVIDSPPILIAPLAVVGAVAVLSTALMRSDVEHRDLAILDPLTGLLNRNSLALRVTELEQQSAVTSEPVGVNAADLDKFKQVNDQHGHPIGDAVLSEVAYLLRKSLGRAFDLAYRVGGDEFVVLLPGASLAETHALAERMRATVGAAVHRPGIQVTMSLGVSASEKGERFDFERVLHHADAALYEAKRNGTGVASSASVRIDVIAAEAGR